MGIIMKRILNKIIGKSYKDNRGLSLVEVLCAVAIMALVTGVIGSVIVISTRTYRRGISETNIQQEAQLAANNIGNIIKDACGVVYGASNEFYVKDGVYNEDGTPKLTDEDGTVRVPDSSGNPKKQSDGFTELSIITNDKIQYTMTYDRINKKLLYQEYNTTDGSPRTAPEVMATNIVDFTADTKDFNNSKTIKLSMKVEDSDTNRSIPMEYTMTSRNGDGEGGTYVTNTDSVVIIFLEDDVVMVPGETYQIPLSVSGKLTEGALEWENVTGLTAGALTLNYAEVTVPIDSAGGPASFVIKTKDKDGDGNPKDTASCNVLIRKVSSVSVSHSIDTSNSRGGMLETAGTVYTFNANVEGSELAKRVAYAYDSNYKTAQAVAWSWELAADGTTYKRNWTCSQNGDGRYEFAESTEGDQAKFDEYISVTLNKEDAIIPQLIMKIEKDMPADFVLTVRATSKHALGVNKADSAYGDKDNAMYFGEDVVKPRETILNQNLEITLEPHETGKVALDMKGGRESNIDFEYHDVSDLRNETNTNGTIATYNEADDSVEITLGKDETGSGKTGAVPYTFTIDVKAGGVVKTTITVHVCRIDELSIEVKDNFTDKKGDVMNLPTYDFRARFNDSNANVTESQRVTANMIQYKADGSLDEEAVRRTFSSTITWELIDHNKNGKVEYSEKVVCMANIGSGEKDNAPSYQKKYTQGPATFEIVHVKPARVEQDASGNWFLKQFPEVDISPSAKTPTGLPENYELKVTIEALHPLGTAEGNKTNKTSTSYKQDVKASASIFGTMTIKAPSPLVIVEPGQGTSSTEMSDKEIVIPISVGGVAAYEMKATISEHSSSDTKIAPYKDGNPYKAGNISSVGGDATWYLGLLIGEKEIGNHAGRIKVHVEAYNSKKEKLASTDFELGVRRVNNIDVKLTGGKKFSLVNKTGNTMTIEATPRGCGNNGTEFYDIQKDEKGNTYRWEQKGHGEYREPSPMEWKMLTKGVEKPLSEWTEYFETNSINTSVNESDHKASVTFKLKKPLPIGSKIRAYSLHARGSNGKDETAAGYVKYNKSGKKYADTYGELTIADDGFQRADEFTFVEDIADMRQGFGDLEYASDQCSFFRYRIKGGAWTPYYQLEDKSPRVARFIGTKESLVFLPENDYDLEIINVVYSKSKKLIYWPLNEALLEAGRGWKEDGFRLWNGDEIMKNSNYDGSYKQQMIEKEHALYEQIKSSKEKWQWTFDVPKVNINFEVGNARPWKVKDSKVTLATMSEATPLHLQGDPANTWTPMDEIAVELAPTSFCLWKRQYHMNAYVDQKVNGVWQEVAVTESGWDAPRPQPNNVTSNQFYWHLQTSCPQFQIYQVYSGSSAEYRIRTMIKGMEWMKINGRLFDRTYEEYNLDTPLYNLSNGEGVLYVSFN